MVGRNPSGRTAEHPAVRAEQLVRFLGWLSLAVFSFSLLGGAAWAVFGDAGSAVTGATLLVYGCSLLAARALANRRRRRGPLAIVCVGFLAATLIVVVAQPSLVPVLTLAPLLAVGIALPYATERTLRVLFAAAWVVAVAVAVLGELVPTSSALPAAYASAFRVASLATAVAVVLMLLWQFRSRLVGSLEQAREAEERALHDATHDHLTGLPNRALFLERLSRTLERATKDGGYHFAVLFLDLDRFKTVNDSLGHSVGDRLLVEVARRLEGCVHPTDTVARLGGDEFTVLLEDIGDPENATWVAERIQGALRAPFGLDGHELYATASVGVIACPTDYRRPEDLLRDADTAMYRAKEAGKARHEVFSPEMRAQVVRLLRLESDLRRAVESGQFAVHYQPIVSLKSGSIVGLEALVRWEHPDRGLTRPSEFVPFAEETELIVPIGLSVLREACRRLSLWRRRMPDRRPLSVSVNLSAAQLSRPELVGQVAGVLRETGLDGRHLRLEITESAIMRDAAVADGVLSGLRALGVRLAIDDFGTGYSSLGLLHRFPVDALKIDRSFVGDLDASPDNAQIVQAMISLGHGLGMDVVAEGVKNTGQLERLRGMGCDYAQGYRLSEPVDAALAEAIIAADPRW